MSEFFYPSNNIDPWDIKFEMANGRAKIFIELTHVAAEYYGVTAPIIIRNTEEDMFCIDAERFSLLVEKAFSQPLDLFYVWAKYATMVYEIIKAERFIWYWGTNVGGLNHFIAASDPYASYFQITAGGWASVDYSHFEPATTKIGPAYLNLKN